jgi:hypothetical protein
VSDAGAEKLMRVVVESWAPEYGAPTEEGTLEPLEPPVLDLEVAPEAWAPISPATGPAPSVVFVDGVQRVDASVVVELDGVEAFRGRCVSYAAGAIRCDGAAEVVALEVRHELLAPDRAGRDLDAAHGTFSHVPVTSDDAMAFSKALHDRMAELEAEVAARASADDLLVMDGPLSGRRHGVHGAVGFVKTHPVAYLPPELAQRVVGRLEAGQRTPVFRLGAGRPAWYLRLPGPVDHAWSGVVRCEAEDTLTGAGLVAVADRTAATLPRFASEAHRDPRAPQNLYPIGGLERELRARLGDPRLWFRALRRATAA